MPYGGPKTDLLQFFAATLLRRAAPQSFFGDFGLLRWWFSDGVLFSNVRRIR